MRALSFPLAEAERDDAECVAASTDAGPGDDFGGEVLANR